MDLSLRLPATATACLAFVVACSSEQPPPNTPAASSPPAASASPAPPAAGAPDAEIPVVALKFSPAGGSKLGAMELTGDGSIVAGGKTIGKLAVGPKGATCVERPEGGSLVCIFHKIVSSRPDASRLLAFSAADDLMGQRGEKIVTVADDGTVSVLKEDFTPDVSPGRFETLPPRGRRAAVFMITAFLFADRLQATSPWPGYK